MGEMKTNSREKNAKIVKSNLQNSRNINIKFCSGKTKFRKEDQNANEGSGKVTREERAAIAQSVKGVPFKFRERMRERKRKRERERR